MTISFGTDGWRGILGLDFTVANAHIVAQAVAEHLKLEKEKPLAVIGYDTRFMSNYFAEQVAKVLAGNGIRVLLTEKPVTSPVVSFATKTLLAEGGIMITASHNPAIYNGIKFKGAYGGSALPETVTSIESCLCKNEPRIASSDSSLIEYFNPDQMYLTHIKSLVDINRITNSGFQVITDPMYGSAQGYFPELFANENLISEIHGHINPSFGTLNPEPIDKNLKELSVAVRHSGAIAGLALDGDGDRIGVICSDGSFMNSHEIFALLLMFLVEHRKQRGGVVKTFSTSRMIDVLAKSYELRLFETQIGFKYICDLFLTEDVLIGGEESGGIGFKGHIPERDGILSGLLLLQLLAETGRSPEALISKLYERIGSFAYARVDLPVHEGARTRFAETIAKCPPSTFAGFPVTEIKTYDGIKLCLGLSGWVLFRFSGTEPVLRLYAEAVNQTIVSQFLAEAEKLVKGTK